MSYTSTRVGYPLGMDSKVVHLPGDLVEQLDARAAGELRSRSNLAAWLIKQGLQDETRTRVDVPAEAN